MATRAKNRKTFKQLLILNRWKDFEIISQGCCLGDPLPKLLTWFTPLDKMATRAKNRKTYKTTTPSKWLTDFENFTKMLTGVTVYQNSSNPPLHLILPTISFVQYGSGERFRAIMTLWFIGEFVYKLVLTVLLVFFL